MSRRVFQVADQAAAGDIAVAPAGAVHGVLNTGSQNLVFVSVVSPARFGFELF